MDSNEILELVYEIQGRSDPAHSADSLAERMQTIYDVACDIMQRTGYDPQ